ncbi:hypothetical protein [Photobacterium galatheae]|uniref:Lipoprotein n=1 Tax=Photobacterium galatheae TaxID=1654360 RepID=A0A066S0F8_9GAMM|nr:hypothetical protein [Photobacterium galatheae]KDM93432.1 hypothetical protein EA58_00780 [Photobacterium galatheae]MCM0147012.1 hypothetical protein [Photobacterium galatheae]
MWVRWLLVLQLCCFLSACASSKIYWRDIIREVGAASVSAKDDQLLLCTQLYQGETQVHQCRVEMTALFRARALCHADSTPDYCVRMAEYTWRHYKSHVLTEAPDIRHANTYPVMCGYQEKSVTPCKKIN